MPSYLQKIINDTSFAPCPRRNPLQMQVDRLNVWFADFGEMRLYTVGELCVALKLPKYQTEVVLNAAGWERCATRRLGPLFLRYAPPMAMDGSTDELRKKLSEDFRQQMYSEHAA